MECDICRRQHHADRLPFLCAVDARNHCYEGRLRNLQILMENEDLQKRINDLLTEKPSATTPSRKLALDSLRSEQRVAEDRTNQIIAQAEKLKTELTAAAKEIEDRRTALARRKSDLASASQGLVARRSRQLEETERSTQMLKYKWNRSAEGMAGTRAFLCMEAAKLYGLRRVKKGASSRYEFKIGGVDITDLASMNPASPEVLSTSLANIAHILVLASHYLAIRLPAEITLPHRDYPRPTIFNLQSSYQHGDVPFPGSTAIPSFGSDNRDRETQYVPRPRPLYVDKQLPVLAKEDPSVHSLFLEGVTLLAYDIAWLCNTQGVSVGDKNSFDDVCHMGRNLYNLLIGQQLHSTQAGRLFPSMPSSPTTKSDSPEQDEGGKVKSWIGRYSHGTAHTFLGGADGTEYTRSFRLPSPMKLADRLKKKLMTEATIPEWEVLEDDAWAIDEGVDDGVMVDGQKERSDKDSDKANGGAVTNSGAGTSGWTKVKNR